MFRGVERAAAICMFLAAIVLRENRCQDSSYCYIPPGLFDGMVVDATIAEPFYGSFYEVDEMPFQITLWSCLPQYCDASPCTCNNPNKIDSKNDNFTFMVTCLLKRTKVSTKKNVCVSGYLEDELHVCRKQYSCAVDNGSCDQLCKHNDTSNRDYCACNEGYVRFFDGKNGTCKDTSTPTSPSTLSSAAPGFIGFGPSTIGMHSGQNNSNENYVFPWPYILAIVLAFFFCLLIVLIVIFWRRHKSTDTRVEKTTVVHYEKETPGKNDAPHVFIVPNNGDGKTNRNVKVGGRRADDDDEYEGVGNLKALSSSPAGVRTNSYGGDDYDHIEDQYLNKNPTYKEEYTKNNKGKVYTMDKEQKRSRKNNSSTTDDVGEYGRKGVSSHEVSIVYGGGHPDTGRRARSSSESNGGRGKGSGNGGGKGKGSAYGIEEIDGKHRGKNSVYDDGIEDVGDKNSGKGRGKNASSVYGNGSEDIDGKNRSKGSGKSRSSTSANGDEIIEMYVDGKGSGKDKNRGGNSRNGKDTLEVEKKQAQSTKEQRPSTSDHKSGSSSGKKHDSIVDTYDKASRNKSAAKKAINRSASSVAAANDYSTAFEKYDEQNHENEQAFYSPVDKLKYQKSVSVDGAYKNGDQEHPRLNHVVSAN